MVIFNRHRLACAVTAAAWMGTSAFAQEPIELQPTTVVTAAGFEQNIADAPASISVISREQLEKQSYTNVVDALKNIPGVYVTGGGQMQDISVRGMSSSYTLYLVDGRPISAGRSVNTNGSDGGKQVGLPPLSMIERIEVIRGPMSSLYGSEAMGGVINIITRKGGNDWAGTFSTEYSHSMNDLQEDETYTSLYLGGALVPDLLGLRLDGGFTRTQEAEFVGGDDGAASTPDGKRKQGGAELYFTPSASDRFAISYEAARLDEAKHPGKSIDSTAVASTTEYDKDIVVLSHDGHYENFQVNTYLQKDVSERVQDLTKKEEVLTFNTQASYFLGDHVITLGGRYKEEELTRKDNGLLSLLPEAVGEMDRWIAAVYAEVDWGITDDLRVTTGMRYDDDELFGGQVSPRVYGVYTFTPELTLKGGVSTGYRQPSLTDATEGFGGTTGGNWQNVNPALPHARAISIGNPDLQPETSTNYEVGFNYTDSAAGVSTSLMLFHTKYEDKIAEDRFCSTDATGDANRNNYAAWACNYGGEQWYFLSTRQNIDEAVIQGVEWTLEYDIAPSLRLSSSYTYTESEQKSGDFKGEPLNKQPKHMANALLDWQITNRLSGWVQGNYRSKTSDYISRTSMSEGTPGYGFVDVGGVYRLNENIDLKAGLYNIANKEVTNEDYEVVLDGRRLVVGMTVDF
ncbi:TonB-dependent receptor domain-containing protein [Stutzerimonas stutzeri]|uniref:Ligand-gated channel protein n=1 Tax=Stutzerimonas stutzeri KOS6 TaxID=1218352 RepID=A0A061JSU6_STUST|nr:TonB-dependent receptor [Stutzerimonas stutzeri]EWC41380.1 ligand-gated channel protein [Stutzerimonas stutzeri KOS6]